MKSLFFRRIFVFQCICSALIFSLDVYGIPDNDLKKAYEAMEIGDCELASSLYLKNAKVPINPEVLYSLAICYSKARNYEYTLLYAVDALTNIPSLNDIYANGAKELVKWAAVELAKPKSISYESSYETTDLSLLAKEAEIEKKRLARIEILKDRVKSYVNVEMAIIQAKFDHCWDAYTHPEFDLQCLFIDRDRPPDVPIP